MSPRAPSAPLGGREGDHVDPVLSGGGEMGALMRSIDWSRTPLGDVAAWPQSLRTTVSTCLNSRFPIVVWWGPEMVKLYNDGYRQMLGSKHPRAMGARGRDIWPEIWHIIGPMLHGVLHEGRATWSENELLFLERSGYAEECYFTYSYSPIRDESGGVGGVFCAVTETTNQVLSDRRLRTLRLLGERTGLVKTIDEVCTTTASVLESDAEDLPFALVYWIEEGTRVARLTSATTRDGQRFPAAIDVRSNEDAHHPVARAARSAKVVLVDDLARFQLSTNGPRDAPHPTSAMALPLTLPGDTEASAVLFVGLSPRLKFDDAYRSFLDLVAGQVATGLASARALEQAERRAEALAELDRAKTVFFSNVSHEFRTPLTLILGPCEDLLAGSHGPVTGAQRTELELVHRNSLRLQKLVNALLDFSRIESGRIHASYESLDLATVTSDIASAFRSAFERAGLRFTVRATRIDEPVFVDRDMWEKIVLNLLSNALKFTFEGGVDLSLSSAANSVELRVSDTGIGVPDDQIPRLFERFHRVEGARARTQEGSGIGLAMVQELVKLHGGAIRAESRVGVGTTFIVQIPTGKGHLPKEKIRAAREAESSARAAAPFVEEALRWLPGRPPTAQPGEASAVPDPVPPRLGRILLADDNADMRDYIRRILEPHWTVDAVRDGAEALQHACEHVPDLIVSDIMMPELDGFGLLRELRAREATRGAPVILLSARAGEEARIEGLQAGAEDYLVKPFAAQELLARVRTHIEIAQQRRAAERERMRLSKLLGRVPAIINFLRGPDLVVEYAHPRGLEALRRYDIVGKPLLEAIPEMRGQEIPALLRRVVETGETIERTERLVWLPDGRGGLRETYWNFVYLPVRDDFGRIEGVMTFNVEVTDRRKAERLALLERERRVAEMERAVRFSEMFIGILGHDLRNPLSAIRSSAGLLAKRGQDAPRIFNPANRILTSALRMDRMIEELLDFTHIRLGRGIPVKRDDADWCEIARTVADEVESATGRKIALQLTGDAWGTWDRDRLSQLVANLAANACQHSPEGTPVELHIDGSLDDTVRFCVSNQGAIPEHLQATLFEPLRPPAEKHEGSSGLGLGLYITEQIVLAHGGTIALESDLARGTRFTVELPRHPRAPESGVFDGSEIVARRSEPPRNGIGRA